MVIAWTAQCRFLPKIIKTIGHTNPWTVSNTRLFCNRAKSSTNIIKRVWYKYDQSIQKRPLLTKCATAWLIIGISDPLTQFLERNYIFNDSKRREMGWNRLRTVKMALGFSLMTTTLFHFWYLLFLDRLFPSASTRTVILKLGLEAFLWAPIHTTLFMTYSTTFDHIALNLENRNRNGNNNNSSYQFRSIIGDISLLKNNIYKKLKQDWLKLYSTGLCIMPIFQFFNFRFVVPRFRLLYLSFVQVFWTAIVSFFVNKNVAGGSGSGSDGNNPRNNLNIDTVTQDKGIESPFVK